MAIRRKDYLCQVTIVEGRELAIQDVSGPCDPFVKVTCGNAPSQATSTEFDTNNPSWNQSFTFSNLSFTDSELETWELKIECFDYNSFTTNKLIGMYSIGLATLNRNSNHEFYNTWIILLHPEHGASPRGYLLVNCFIVGPDDVPPAHAIGEQMGLDEDAEDSELEDDDLLTPEQRKLKKMKKQAIGVVKTPMIAKKNYQLSINIYKAEKLPKFDGRDANPFVSARTCGIVEKTHSYELNSNPIWNIKMSFLATTPILNDRITIRIWDHRPRSRDKLIATLPEVPHDHDFFNISNLISRGGVLPCRWINIYGQSEEEDTIWNDLKKLTGLAKKSYIGTCYYGRVLISMTVSPNDDPETGISKAAPYREPISKVHLLRVTLYELKNADACGDLVEIKISIGTHFVFSSKVKKKEKLESTSKKKVKSEGKSKKKDKNEDSSKIVAFVWGTSYSGEVKEIKEPFAVDPDQVPDVILDLYSYGLLGKKRIGYIRKPIKDIIGDDSPLWIPFKSIDSHSNIGMASPGLLLSSIYFGIESDENSRANKLKPRKVMHWLCWHIYGGLDMAPAIEDSDTNLRVKIFCGDRVFVIPKSCLPKIPSKFPIWKWTGMKKVLLHEDLHFEQNLRVEVFNKSKMIKLIKTNTDIGQFSIPLYTCATPWKQAQYFHVVNSDDIAVSQGRIIAEFFVSSEKMDKSKNPCAIKLDTFMADVEIALLGIRGLNPPYEDLKITLEIPGYTFADGKPVKKTIPEEETQKKGKNDEKKKKKEEIDKSNPMIQQIIRFEGIELPRKAIFLPAIHVRFEDTALLSWNKSFTYISLINYCNWIEDELEKRDAIEKYKRNFTEKELIEQLPVTINEDNKKVVLNAEIITDYGSDEDIIVDGNQSEPGRVKNKINMNDIFEPKNSKLSYKIEFDKEKKHEDEELILREQTRAKYDAKLNKIREEVKKKFEKKGEIPEALKAKLRKTEKKLELAMKPPLNVSEFLKKDDELEEADFQYGRRIHKNGLLDDDQKPPYERYQLFKKSKNSDKLSVFRVGEPIGSVLKATVNIKERIENEPEFPDPKSMDWKFNFFHPIFQKSPILIESFAKEDLAVRVYLLRALSLCAVDNASDLPAFAAGLEALSSANSYPEIQVGETRKRNLTYFFDKVPEKDTLNPEYFRVYELQGTLPSDWRLVINIWNESSMGFDGLIGSTFLDIEDRFYGNHYESDSLMLKVARKFVEKQIENDVEPAKRDWLNACKKKIKRAQLDLKDKREPVPVEYRPLSSKGKKTFQGMLEMFVEVLDMQASKLVPVSKIAKPLPEKYELRLVIWKCEGIPMREDKKTVDIFFRVQFDPTGWLGESHQRETDCHAGSEDGHGVFNWRMKFEFELPCNFARIRMVAYDFSTFGDDQMQSEIVLDLAKHFRRVMKEGKLAQEEQWVQLLIPGANKPGGQVLISFAILSLAEANQRPVGEGQDEPNRDPELEKPEEGRGILDFLKGTALDVSKWSLFNLGLLKKLLLLLSMAGTVVVLFIYPGVVSKPN